MNYVPEETQRESRLNASTCKSDSVPQGWGRKEQLWVDGNPNIEKSVDDLFLW
jgi:hypothetical protein